jgi:beta-phosphoglucomutase-like phosphatase (HAD superfamily)
MTARCARARAGQSDEYLGPGGERVEPYEPAIALVRALRQQEIKTAVVSSSNNCALVLEAAGIAELFDARGRVGPHPPELAASRHRMRFLRARRRRDPSRAVVA